MEKGIGRPVVVASMPVVRFSGEGNTGGEWGVKRGGGSAASFPGEEGSSGRQQRVREAAAAPGQAFRGRRRSGRLTGVSI
jgi:hypothetical protein